MPQHLRALVLLVLLLAAVAIQTGPWRPLGANEVGPAVAAQTANLSDTLSKGLKARLPGEFRFIEQVVAMVEADELPLRLVYSTFLWARKKAETKKYPFPYFERGLRVRAARLGIQIP